MTDSGLQVLHVRPLGSKRGDDFTLTKMLPGGEVINTYRCLLWCWASAMSKDGVKAAVGQGHNGDYLFRSSSKDDQVVLAVNDNGDAVDYPVTWLPSSKSWSFVDREFESLRVRSPRLCFGPPPTQF